MQRVILESPFAGDREANIEYAQRCLRDCLLRDEAPFASHLLYTQVLEDDVAAERQLGINAGFAWGEVCDTVVVYTDLCFSRGMLRGIHRAMQSGFKIEYRRLLPDERRRTIHCFPPGFT